MPLILLLNTCILTQFRQLQSSIRPHLHLILSITKADASFNDEQVENLTREFNIHYKACIGWLIYLLSTRVDLSFAMHKLAKFSSNPGKVHFEGLVHLLSYITENNTLGLKYYADMNDAPVSDMLRKVIIKTDNE